MNISWNLETGYLSVIMGSKTHQKNLQDNAKEIKALIKRSNV